jgi:uncharacterized membrane protein AbrB (regulator of aidB expression)
VWKAFIIGAAFVGIVEVLAHYRMATPMPFWLLLPGIVVVACLPGSGFDLKNSYSLGPVFVFLLYAVNVAVYGGLAYLMLRFGSAERANTSK